MCSLVAVDTFPDTKFVVAETSPANIFLESQCGRIPLNADVPMATFIDQNSPNPFMRMYQKMTGSGVPTR